MRLPLSTLLHNPRLRLVAAEELAAPPAPAAASPALAAGALHEWTLQQGLQPPACGQWAAPLTVMAWFAGQAAANGGHLVWIGRACWPSFQLLHAICLPEAHQSSPSPPAPPSPPEAPFDFRARRAAQALSLPRAPVDDRTARSPLRRCTFLDPATDAERFWVIAEALRCPGVAAVVADGSALTPTVSRRLQLAAESGRALGLLARPPWEMGEGGGSWAHTRWHVRSRLSRPAVARQEVAPPRGPDPLGPAWEIECVSCRGKRPEQDAPRRWMVDWAYQVFRGTGALHLSAGVGRATAAATPPRNGHVKTA